MAPKGLPAGLTADLAANVARALRGQELLKAFDTNGAVPRASSPQEFRAYLARDIAQNKKAVDTAGVQPE